MLCLACSAPSSRVLCPGCRRTLHRAPDRVLTSGLLVRAAWCHEGAARTLVHRLKYRPVSGVAECLAWGMAAAVSGVDGLVPIPRARLRAWQSGVDPSVELARALARITGVPVVSALCAPLWWPRHAAAPRDARSAVRFRAGPSPGVCALVDDVVTTGATAQSAADALGSSVRLVVAATVAGTMNRG